jgi:small subunit ribosomal protein S13
MARILGNNLSNKKQIAFALTIIYGIGRATSLKILQKLNINPHQKVSELTEANFSSLRDLLEKEEWKVEGELKRMVQSNIRRLIDINCYRGRRHLRGLPVRGQRTRTNARTCRKYPVSSSK